MKGVPLVALVLGVAAGSFLAGNLRNHYSASPTSTSSGTAGKILYYVDPMNPAHTSDRPGLAPCGMKMEPVYADAAAEPHSGNNLKNPAVGSVKVSPVRQQLAGIQVTRIEKRTSSHSLRLPGKVVADETRVYRINAGMHGWISRTSPSSTGSLVEKDEVLADMNSPELLPAVQSLLFALNTRDQPVDGVEPGVVSTNSLIEIDLTYLQSLEALRNLGMGSRQLETVAETHKLVNHIEIASPAKGVLLARNVSEGLHVEKGMELFRVADLSRIWVLTDISGWESEYLTPGSEVRVSASHQAKPFIATVGKALPLIDNDSRTLKVRLELDNPDYALRPDMFVDVELSIELPEMIIVNADAVLDSGRKQTVFTDRGGGFFEPKEVRTGRRLGDQVEIVNGLTPGEWIVTSGNFLLDSESRMKQAAAGVSETDARDPVCGMTVDAQEVRTEGQFSVYAGQTYYFCNPGCKRAFDAEPVKYLEPKSRQTAEATLTDEHPELHP
jgi:RND family efflux transporter MFP subunit